MILKRNIFKEKRESKGLSLDDLGAKTGIESSELEEIESFDKEVEYKDLNKLKEILEINDEDIEKYFNYYHEIKTKESKVIKNNLILNLSSLAYVLCYFLLLLISIDVKLFFIYVVIGYTFIVGSYVSLIASKNLISDKKYYLLLGIFTILFILTLAVFTTLTLIICNQVR